MRKAGFNHSLATREKISKTRIERKIGKGEHNSFSTEFKKGSKINLGRKHTLESKIKIGLSGKGRIPWNKGLPMLNKRGPNSYNWKGGTYETERKAFEHKIEYKQWRLDVFKRDDYTCQNCKKRGGKLNADHIKSYILYPDLRLDLNNGRTLCIPCHKKTETYGYKSVLLNNIKKNEEIQQKEISSPSEAI